VADSLSITNDNTGNLVRLGYRLKRSGALCE